jgi:hypothetical protein
LRRGRSWRNHGQLQTQGRQGQRGSAGNCSVASIHLLRTVPPGNSDQNDKGGRVVLVRRVHFGGVWNFTLLSVCSRVPSCARNLYLKVPVGLPVCLPAEPPGCTRQLVVTQIHLGLLEDRRSHDIRSCLSRWQQP